MRFSSNGLRSCGLEPLWASLFPVLFQFCWTLCRENVAIFDAAVPLGVVGNIYPNSRHRRRWSWRAPSGPCCDRLSLPSLRDQTRKRRGRWSETRQILCRRSFSVLVTAWVLFSDWLFLRYAWKTYTPTHTQVPFVDVGRYESVSAFFNKQKMFFFWGWFHWIWSASIRVKKENFAAFSRVGEGLGWISPALIGITVFRWNLLGFTGFYCVLLGCTGFYWSFIGFYWVLPGFQGVSFKL